jgi:hypothetical protein
MAVSRQVRRRLERERMSLDFHVTFPGGHDASESIDFRALGTMKFEKIDGVLGFRLPAPFADLTFTRGEVLTLEKGARLKSALAYFKLHPVTTRKEQGTGTDG